MTTTILDAPSSIIQDKISLVDLFGNRDFQEPYEDYMLGQMIEIADTGDTVSVDDFLSFLKV